MQTFGTNPKKYTMNVIGFGHKEIIRYLCQRNYSIKITKMKKIILTMAIAFAAVVNVCGQSELIGRVYHCDNMFAAGIKEVKAQADKNEMSNIQAITSAITAKRTVKFIDGKTAHVTTVLKFDEDKAKANGASWFYRKMAKMKFKTGQSSGNTSYTIKGNKLTIISVKSKKPINYELSQDGKTLTEISGSPQAILKRIK